MINIDDNKLIELVQKDGDSKAFRELVSRHSGIFNNIASKIVDKKVGDGLSVDKASILESKLSIIYESIMSYNPGYV